MVSPPEMGVFLFLCRKTVEFRMHRRIIYLGIYKLLFSDRQSVLSSWNLLGSLHHFVDIVHQSHTFLTRVEFQGVV